MLSVQTVNPIFLPFIFIVCVLIWYGRRSSTKVHAPFPPGPKPIPFIGNLHQFPQKEKHKTFAAWSEHHGPVVYFNLFGRPFVVLNDLENIDNLLVKRSAIYSSRPHMVMAGDLVGRQENTIVFLKYGERWKFSRRVINKWVGNVVDTYPVLVQVHQKFLRALLDWPEDSFDHVRFAVGSLILRLTYGIECAERDDPYVTIVEKMSRINAEATAPGKWLCDSFPILAKLPPWMPFAKFRTWAMESREFLRKAVKAPYDFTRESVLRGEHNPSWLAEMLSNEDEKYASGESAIILQGIAAALYIGAIDTSVATMHTFLWAMARHPEIQKRAQIELDAIIGQERLPNPEDKDSLPYLNNVIKECVRFASVVPFTPHSLEEDDIYMGYHIPKGSWVIANIWAILHNPKTFSNPEDFNPDRFEETEDHPAEPNLTHIAFGFGRRSCPGYQLGMATLFMQIASMLWAFDFKAATGDVCDTPPGPIEFEDGHIRAPRPFKLLAIPRDEKKVELIRRLSDGESI